MIYRTYKSPGRYGGPEAIWNCSHARPRVIVEIILIAPRGKNHGRAATVNPKAVASSLLAALERLSLKKKNPRRRKGPKKSGGKRKRGTRDPADGTDHVVTSRAAGVASAVLDHPAVARAEPLATAVAAQIAPFNVAKGLAKKLTDTRQSQAVTSRGATTFTVPSGQTALFFMGPSACSDPAAQSFSVFVCPAANLNDATSTITSSSAGVNPANTVVTNISTNTPYAGAALSGGNMSARLVGAGLRIRNVSEALYRGGMLRYLMDSDGIFGSQRSATTTTYQGWIDNINATQTTVRKHFSDASLVEILYPAHNCGWISDSSDFSGYFDCRQGMKNATAVGSFSSAETTRVGGAASPNAMSSGPGIVGYFTNSSSGAQNIDIEVVEHWEFHGSAITTLHTPGVPHINTQNLIDGMMEHVATNHSQNPHLHFKDVVKEGVKLSHNKAAVKDAELAASIAMCL